LLEPGGDELHEAAGVEAGAGAGRCDLGTVVIKAEGGVLDGGGGVGVKIDDVGGEAVGIELERGKRRGFADEGAGLLVEPVGEVALAAKGEGEVGGFGGIVADTEGGHGDAQVGVAVGNGDDVASEILGFVGEEFLGLGLGLAAQVDAIDGDAGHDFIGIHELEATGD
jgi:hypothetical protein